MVKIFWKHWIGVFLIMVLVLVGGAAFWLLATTGGARWLVGKLTAMTDQQVSVAQVKGSLSDTLILSGIEARYPEMRVDLDRLKVSWRPGALLRGKVLITGLEAQGLSWMDLGKSEETEFELQWPELPGWLQRIRAEVRRFELRDLVYQGPDREPQSLDHVSGQIRWTGELLDISSMTMSGPPGDLSAALRMHWPQRRLKLRVAARLEEVVEGEARGEMILELHPAKQGPGLAGAVTLKVDSRPTGKVDLSGRLELENSTVALRSLLLQAAENGKISGDLQLGLSSEAPQVAADLRLDSINLARFIDEPTSISGSLQVDGNLDDYRGRFDLENRVEDWRAVKLAANFSGNARQVHFSELQARFSGNGKINGDLRLDMSSDLPDMAADLRLDSVNLVPFTGQATNINGMLRVAGSMDDYHGRFDLENRSDDWRAVKLSGDFSGNTRQVVLPDLQAHLLRGRLGGALTAAWEPVLSVQGQLTGKGLNPAAYDAQWPGDLSFDLQGRWRQPPEGPMDLAVKGRLLESTLRGYGFRGRIDASMQGTELDLTALELQGEGIQLTARGKLSRRIDYQARVGNLATLLPDASGSLQSSGWLRRRNDQWTGTAEGTGRNLRYEDHAAENIAFSAKASDSGSGDLNLRLRQLKSGDFLVPGLDLQASGSLQDHRAESTIRFPEETSLELAVSGGYREKVWRGTLQKLLLREPVGPWRLQQPVSVAVSANFVKFDNLRMTGTGGEELTASADLTFPDLAGRAQVQWQALRLGRLEPWLQQGDISGQTSGRGLLLLPSGGEAAVSLEVELSGRYEQEDFDLTVTRAQGDLEWNRQGLTGTLAVNLARGVRLDGRVRSDEPAGRELPRSGEWELVWNGLNLQHLEPWLPTGITARGEISGTSQGNWAPGGVLAARGSASLNQGLVETSVAETVVSLPLENAELTWDWRDDRLEAQSRLMLADRGRLTGRLRLPLPARMPVSLEPTGRLAGQVEGSFQEQGLVAALFPGLVQETRGNMEMDVDIAGTWAQPEFDGGLQLSDAGAFLPAAGIELKDIRLQAAFKKDRVELASFSVKSGPGQINGTGTLRLREWELADYQGTLQGERFELIDLPELQALISPQLDIQGTAEEVFIRGTVRVPDLLLREIEREEMLLPSEDVVIVGEAAPPEPVEEPAPLTVRADIDIILGDHVLVKMAGLDARLTGNLNLKMAGLDDVKANGRISVAEGDYRAYGAKLKIERGNLLFSGPVEQPTLDILALRSVGDVKAGVRVTGTPRSPTVELTSDPAMSDSDKLAYIVLGRPFAADGGEASLLMTAAGALLGRGESVVLQDRLKRQLGVDVLGFEAGEGDITESMLTIGKYLNPDLYVSIGQSLFTETTEFRMRYTLGEHWELESKTGTESGVDLYYKIEFR
ncbi:MAG: translocation/assembly module TamB domain-containing protein [Syntrophotaleaceae bacterium]